MPTKRFILPALIATLSLPAVAHAAPAHDDVGDAAEISGLPFDMHVDTSGATDEEFEASLSGDGTCLDNPGVWARITPSETTTVIAVIDGPQDGAVGLFQGDEPGSLSFVYCMRSLDGRVGSSDGNLHTLEAGVTYSLRFATADVAAGAFDFSLSIASGITGRARLESGRDLDGTLVWAYDPAHRKIAAACSHDGGRYRISGLPAGTYRLEYRIHGCGSGEPGATEWYRDAGSFADATPVVVRTTGDTTEVDVVLGQKPRPSETPTVTSEPRDDPTGAATRTAETSQDETTAVEPSPVAGRSRSSGLVVGLLVVVLLLSSGVGAAYVARRKA